MSQLFVSSQWGSWKCVSAVCHTLAIWPTLTAAPTAPLTLGLHIMRASLLAPLLARVGRAADMHRHHPVAGVVVALACLRHFALCRI